MKRDFKWNRKTNQTDMWQPSTKRSYVLSRSDKEIIEDPSNVRQEHVQAAIARATLEMMDLMENYIGGDAFNMDKLRQMMEEVAVSKWEEKAFAKQGEMSEEELAKHFAAQGGLKSGPNEPKVSPKPDLDTLQGIKKWEESQDNATDIYKIKARIQNEASAAANANLTQQGEMLVNCFTHVIKAFYDFADRIVDPKVRQELRVLIRSQENMPARFMAGIHGEHIAARKEKQRAKKTRP